MPQPVGLPGRRAVRAIIILVLLDIAGLVLGTAAGVGALAIAGTAARHVDARHMDTIGGRLGVPLRVASVALGIAKACWIPWQPLASFVGTATPLRIAGQVGPVYDLAYHGSTAAADAVGGAGPLLDTLGHKHGSGEASVRVFQGLAQGHTEYQGALENLRDATGDLRALDLTLLPIPANVREHIPTVRRLLPRAEEVLAVAVAGPDLLGGNGPRAYLIAPENSWDLRATGGFIGTEALLTVDHGHLTLTSRPSDTVDNGRQTYIQPPLPLVTYEHFSNWFYRDANWLPNYPTTASLLSYFYWLGQRRVPGVRYPDGVIAFDNALLAPLLSITGPITVTVDGTPVTIDAAHGIDVLDHYINATGTVNKSVAGLAYTAVFHRLTSLHTSALLHAATVLGRSLNERHILIWMRDPTIANILAAHGWDGAVDTGSGDYVYVVDTNVHYNKINNLVHEEIAYRARIDPDRSIYSTLSVTYTNLATQLELPPPQNNTLYEDFARIMVPLGSRLLHVYGLTEHWATTRLDNRTVFAGYFRVPSLSERTITWVYKVPANALLDSHTYQLTIQKQPGMSNAVPLSVAVRPGSPRVRVGSGTQWSWRGDLSTDTRLTASLKGGKARPIAVAYDARPVTIAPGVQLDAWTALPEGIPKPPG